MKKKVTKKRVVRKTETAARKFVAVRSKTGGKYELTKNEIRDFGASRSWRNSVLFTDLAATLYNLRNLVTDGAVFPSLVTVGQSGTGPKYMSFVVRHNVEDRTLRIGCQTFTDKAYNRILKQIEKTGLYSV